MGSGEILLMNATHAFRKYIRHAHAGTPQIPDSSELAELLYDIARNWEHRFQQPDSFSYSHPEPPRVPKKHKVPPVSLSAAQAKLAKDLGLSPAEFEKAQLKHARLESRQAAKSKPSSKKPSAAAPKSKPATATQTERQETKANYRKIKRAQIKKAQKYGISLSELERKQLKKAIRKSRRQAEKVKSAATDKAKSPSFKLDTPATSSTRTQYAFTSSKEFRRLPIGHRLMTEQLFGPDIKKLWVLQNSVTTCYRLSLFDSIFQHPSGRQVLDSLEIRKAVNGFTVRFPEQNETVLVTYKMLNHEWTATSEHIGPAILEQAISKHFPTLEEANDIGESSDVIKFMVPAHLQPKGRSFNWNPEAMAAQIRTEIGARDDANVAISPDEYEAGLLALIRKAKSKDPDERASVPFMTALRGGHIRSPRLDLSTKDEIVLFNPSSKSRFEQVPMWDTVDEKGKVIKGFVNSFRLIGFGRELPDALESIIDRLHSNPVDGLTFELRYLNEAGNMNRLAEILREDPQLRAKLRREAPEEVRALKRRFRNAGKAPPL